MNHPKLAADEPEVNLKEKRLTGLEPKRQRGLQIILEGGARETAAAYPAHGQRFARPAFVPVADNVDGPGFFHLRAVGKMLHTALRVPRRFAWA